MNLVLLKGEACVVFWVSLPEFLCYSHFTSLPPTIDPTVATDALRRQHEPLLNLICHCLLQVADSLLSQNIIPRHVYEKACNEHLGSTERGVALLDCIGSRIEVVPSDFSKVVDVLKAEPFLELVASELVHTYCECYL